jgi:hypothetical protein
MPCLLYNLHDTWAVWQERPEVELFLGVVAATRAKNEGAWSEHKEDKA